jgi:hypothetical protein
LIPNSDSTPLSSCTSQTTIIAKKKKKKSKSKSKSKNKSKLLPSDSTVPVPEPTIDYAYYGIDTTNKTPESLLSTLLHLSYDSRKFNDSDFTISPSSIISPSLYPLINKNTTMITRSNSERSLIATQ